MAVKTPGEYPPLPARRRALVLLLAVATAVTIVLMLLYRPGDPKREAVIAARQRVANAAIGAASGVGGKAEVILLPSAASSPR
jgi:hypothetical protein